MQILEWPILYLTRYVCAFFMSCKILLLQSLYHPPPSSLVLHTLLISLYYVFYMSTLLIQSEIFWRKKKRRIFPYSRSRAVFTFDMLVYCSGRVKFCVWVTACHYSIFIPFFFEKKKKYSGMFGLHLHNLNVKEAYNIKSLFCHM